MNQMKMMMTAATLAAIVMSAGTAMAVPVTPRPVPSQPPNPQKLNQRTSNEQLRVARRHIEIAIDGLQRDASDYGGHKEAARDDLGVARQFLEQGLAYRQQHGGGHGHHPVPVPLQNTAVSPVPVPVVPSNGGNGVGNGNGNADNRNQRGSSENIMDVRSHVEAAIDALNQDRDDYGGYKQRAIDKLQQARQELEAALDFIHNPGVRNGGTGEGVSNANLRYVNEHINTAISSLQNDRNDYGGHRVAAINDLQAASNDIASALAYDKSHPGKAQVQNIAPVAPTVQNTANGQIGQHRSNASLETARQNVETAIDALSRDAQDYGGFRVKAVDELRAARTQLEQALRFQH